MLLSTCIAYKCTLTIFTLKVYNYYSLISPLPSEQKGTTNLYSVRPCVCHNLVFRTFFHHAFIMEVKFGMMFTTVIFTD